MAKIELKQLNVNEEVFKRIKKYKRTIYILENNDILLEKNQNVIVINDNKKLKRKVTKTYEVGSTEELKKSLSKKAKYIYPKDFESTDKVNAIEFKYNKKIFRKILLVLLIIVMFILGISSIDKMIKDINDKKVISTIDELEKEKISYVFIEINPSLVLTIKDNIVQDVACLNEDCISFYNEIDIKGKSINDSIDNIYNLSKDKGFNVSNGVKIKTTDKLEIENKDYITVEYIDETTTNELLSNVKNNEEIKNSSNEDYYTKLWEELKKDSDYDKVYSCNMVDGVLKCFIKEDMFILDESDYTYADLPFVIQRQNEVSRILSKFGVKAEIEVLVPTLVEDLSIFINDIEFKCDMDGYCNPSPHIHDNTENLNIWGDLSLFDSQVGLNLLNPNEVLNHLLYEEENDIYNDYYGYEFNIYVEKICDINIDNCKNYKYKYCDIERINETENSYEIGYTNCKEITAQMYQDYYDEYVVKKRGWGCMRLDEYGIKGQYVCTLEEYYEEEINNPTIIDYVRCIADDTDDINSKNCTSISLTKEEFKDIEMSYPHEDGKVYKIIDGVSKVCELDRNTLKFKCVNEYNY